MRRPTTTIRLMDWCTSTPVWDAVWNAPSGQRGTTLDYWRTLRDKLHTSYHLPPYNALTQDERRVVIEHCEALIVMFSADLLGVET